MRIIEIDKLDHADWLAGTFFQLALGPIAEFFKRQRYPIAI
jgi:hypothetical protein